jgi:hypothetical protein
LNEGIDDRRVPPGSLMSWSPASLNARGLLG